MIDIFEALRNAEKDIDCGELSGLPNDLARRIVSLKKWAQDAYFVHVAKHRPPQIFGLCDALRAYDNGHVIDELEQAAIYKAAREYDILSKGGS